MSFIHSQRHVGSLWQSPNTSQNNNFREKCGGIPSNPNDTHRKSFGTPPLTASILGQPFESIENYYALGPQIGEGVTGVVRRCTDRKTCLTMACKTMSKSDLQDRIAIKDLRSEVAALKMAAEHPGVVRLKDTFEDEKNVHLVMDICEGGELFDRIKNRKRYTERNAAHVCRTVASVLAHCHSKGIVHRDIKPENIFLVSRDSDVDVKVGDFGLSTFFRAGVKLRRRGGSPFYIAPEVLDQSYGQEADLWSLGVVLYILLCGVPPFPGETQEEIFKRVRNREVNMERGPWKEISAEAKDLVSHLLCLDPELRITAGQVKGHPWIKQHCFSPPIAQIVQSLVSPTTQKPLPQYLQNIFSTTPLESPISSGGSQGTRNSVPLSCQSSNLPASLILTGQKSSKNLNHQPLDHILKSVKDARRRSSDFSPICVPSVTRTRRHSIEIAARNEGAGNDSRRMVCVKDSFPIVSPSPSIKDTGEATGRLLRLLSSDSENGSVGFLAEIDQSCASEEAELAEREGQWREEETRDGATENGVANMKEYLLSRSTLSSYKRLAENFKSSRDGRRSSWQLESRTLESAA